MLKYCIAVLLILGCKSYTTNNVSSSGQATANSNLAAQPTSNESTKEQQVKLAYVNRQIDSIKNIAAETDIIFRGGTDIESNIIRDFSNTDKMFSHCGIILKKGNRFAVTHILGGTTNPGGSILSQPIDDFLSYPDNESAGIYSTGLSEKEKYKLYYFIDSLQKQKVTFDLHFNLFTKQQLYCSEMVIDALAYAKSNKNLVAPTYFKLKNTKYFMLANTGSNFLFYPIDVFQHHKALTPKGIFLFPNYQK